MILDG
jgi:serum/glucocorticoid-regulated kinase 2